MISLLLSINLDSIVFFNKKALVSFLFIQPLKKNCKMIYHNFDFEIPINLKAYKQKIMSYFEFLIANYPIPFYLGGTSILIVVVVAIDTVTQIQTRMMSSQYEQLIKKTQFGK